MMNGAICHKTTKPTRFWIGIFILIIRNYPPESGAAVSSQPHQKYRVFGIGTGPPSEYTCTSPAKTRGDSESCREDATSALRGVMAVHRSSLTSRPTALTAVSCSVTRILAQPSFMRRPSHRLSVKAKELETPIPAV